MPANFKPEEDIIGMGVYRNDLFATTNHGAVYRFKDIGAGLKNMVGGELKAYTQLLQESRNEALYRMLVDAQSRGANAVVNVRFATSSVSGGAAELLAYGTAVTVQ